MRLTSVPLKKFSNINDFQYTSQWSIRATDPQTLYFQTADLDNTSSPSGSPMNSGFFGFPGPSTATAQRYIPGVGGSNQPVVMTVTFPSLDPSLALTYTATQNPNDGSVFSIVLPGYAAAGSAPASGNVQFSLTQNTTTLTWTVQNMLSVETLNSGSC